MFRRSDYYDPDVEFGFISNKEFWFMFVQPYPIDLSDHSKGSIIFAKFFSVRNSLIKVNKNYLNSSKEIRKIVFLTLINFLDRFKKPIFEAHILISKHKSVPLRADFNPLKLGFTNPGSMAINKESNGFLIEFEKNIFSELYEYMFNKKLIHNEKFKKFAYSFNVDSFFAVKICF